MGHYDFVTKKDLLKALGMDDNGERLTNLRPRFISEKRTIDTSKATKMVGKTARLADDRKHQVFRKENYYATVQSIRELKAQQEAEKMGILPTMETPVSTFAE